MPTLDEKKAAMNAKSASDSAEALVLPRFQLVEIPPRVAKAYPELTRWNRENYAALEQWREKANVVIGRGITGAIAKESDEVIEEVTP